MDDLDDPMSADTNAFFPGLAPCHSKTETPSAAGLQPAPDPVNSRAKWNDDAAPWRAGEFYKLLPSEAIQRFESMAAPYRCNGSRILLSQGESPVTVLFLLEGKVKVTLNSIHGRRLILGIAGPG